MSSHPAQRYVLAIDQGTTGSTALVINEQLQVLGRANHEFTQYFPQPGWVEHEPSEIINSVERAVQDALKTAGVDPQQVAAIGVTNQRETIALWDRSTGEPLHRAIVWQCRRTSAECGALKEAGHESRVSELTGLRLDPYFSGTKMTWLLDHVEGARARAEAGELAFGTMDTMLAWHITGGEVHVTDASNASRTLLMDLQTGEWSDELCALLNVPRVTLPEIRSNSEVYGYTKGFAGLPDGIPLAGLIGDQQGALFGQACFNPGEAKCTYGTGAFLLMNTGLEPKRSEAGLLTTVAWRLGEETSYALEGSAFIAGAAVQWLRDGLKVIQSAPEIEGLAREVESSEGVYFVPALTGLGAPHWDPEARGLICGLTRGTSVSHLARATLEGIAHQNAELLEAMERDSGTALSRLKVDGGASANALLMQLQADLLGCEIERPVMLETTALGSGLLAGMAVGIWRGLEGVREAWKRDALFSPQADEADVEAMKRGWQSAVRKARLS
jgi:glycerol kinase